MKKPLRAALLAAALAAAVLAGQSVEGTLTDPAGGVVAGQAVVLLRPDRSWVAEAVTRAQGGFALVAPAGGRYLLTVRRAGFAPLELAVTLRAGQITAAGLQLTLEAAAARVTVAAEPGGASSVDEAAQAVTVIGRADLALPRVALVADAVEGAAGAQTLRTSPALGAIFVRGLTGNKVSVYRDGVRYTNGAQRGGISTFLNLMTPASLESVEILRGPNSAQYGSDSMGGTVALQTRAAASTGWHGEAAALYQSAAQAGGGEAMASYGGARGGLLFTAQALRSNTLRTGRGVDSHAAVTRFFGLPATPGRLPDTAFTAYGGQFHGQLRPGRHAQWTLHYERSQQDGAQRPDQLLGGDGNWIAGLRNLMLDFGYAKYQAFAAAGLDQLSVAASFNAQREERVNQGGQGNPLGAITHQYEKTRVWGLQALAQKRWARVETAAGGEFYAERVAAPSFTVDPVRGAVALVRPRVPDGARYSSDGTFAQVTARPVARIRWTGALRYGGARYQSRAARSPLVNGQPLWPDDDLSARAFSGRAGVAAWAADWAVVHAHYSRGFRAPNVTDLGTLGLQGNGQYEAAVADLAGRGAQVGDRADELARPAGAVERLRPELSHNFDGGLRLRRTRWQAELGAFWLKLDNTIVSQTLMLPAGAVGTALGEQTIARQLASGAVFVPGSAAPVLVRANFSGARLRGWEHAGRLELSRHWSLRENVTYTHAADARTGLPPDIEPGVPPLAAHPVLRWQRRSKWVEGYATLAGRQTRLSSLALADRRIGNSRSRANIQAFFQNGARTRGLVAGGLLTATGETLAQVQTRVLGAANAAPQFTAVPGYAVWGIRAGWTLGERTQLVLDASNLGDKNYRGIGWGVDGAGRGVAVRWTRVF